MSFPFPTEIWLFIAKLALLRPWTSNQFNRPLGDFDGIEGFAQTLPVFKEIVHCLKAESFRISLMELSRAQIEHSSARRVRCLQIQTRNLDESSEALHHSQSLFEKLACFSMLTSLSFSAPGPPLQTLYQLQKLPFANSLESIDIRGTWESEYRAGIAFDRSQSHVVCFPNLLRLRLSKEAWIETERIPEQIVHILASFLGGCQKLELFSIHSALDDDAWLEQRSAHMRSIDHLQPSEGYLRYIGHCPLCFENYDHANVVKKENAMTRCLAEQFPNLSEVRWANLWAKFVRDECGQRGTRITREGSKVVLVRVDGMNEHSNE
ncbi:hypothetical protein ACEPAI_3628 [Sanghuangporus weigelae]